MKWFCLTLALIACAIALAQHPVTTSDVAWPQKTSAPIPPVLTDLAWHWVASDLAAGSTVTNWLDRIQSTPWKGVGDSTSPTNTATNGVFFNGSSSQVLTGSVNVTQTAINTNVTMFLILQRTGSGSFQSVLSQNNGGNWVWGWESPRWDLDASGTIRISDGDPGTVPFDLAFSSFRSPSDTSIGYTNGVPYATNAAYIMSVPQTMTRLGGISGEFFTGYIRELFIYTNALVAAQIALLHQYATNTYGYTP